MSNHILVHLHHMNSDDLHKLVVNCSTIIEIKTGSRLSWDTDRSLSLEKLVRMALEVMCDVK